MYIELLSFNIYMTYIKFVHFRNFGTLIISFVPFMLTRMKRFNNVCIYVHLKCNHKQKRENELHVL